MKQKLVKVKDTFTAERLGCTQKYFDTIIKDKNLRVIEEEPHAVLVEDDANAQWPILKMDLKCTGHCGMNYCDEHGCIENKPKGNEGSEVSNG